MSIYKHKVILRCILISILLTLDHQLVGGNLGLLNHMLLSCYLFSVLFTIALKTTSIKKKTTWHPPTSKLNVKYNMVKTNETSQPMPMGGRWTQSSPLNGDEDKDWDILGTPLNSQDRKKTIGLFVESSKVGSVRVLQVC